MVVWDAGHHRKITVVRTRAGPSNDYERERCLIAISGEGLDQPRFLSLCDFGHVEASWITEKLILIQLYPGRIAAVEAIYDVEENKFVYRQSVSYGWLDEPTNPVAASQLAPPESVPPKPAPLIPEGAPPPTFLTKEAQGGATYEIGVYVVKSGDNLTAIAYRLHLSVKDLRTLNPELTGDRITVGQQIRVYEKPGD